MTLAVPKIAFLAFARAILTAVPFLLRFVCHRQRSAKKLPIPPHSQINIDSGVIAYSISQQKLFYHMNFFLSTPKMCFYPFLSSIKNVASISAILSASARGNISSAFPTVFLFSSPEKPMWYLIANASSRESRINPETI